METRALGLVPVPVIGQGTWMMERGDRAAVVRGIRRGLDLGMTHIDTAEMYGQGRVEELVGEAIAGRRSEVFLVDKVLPSNASDAGTRRACEDSLRRLRTETIDCYLLHWPGPHPLEETLRAFERLQAEGKIRAFGVSNFDVGELEHAVALAGPGRIACNQVLYHLGERYVEHELLPRCAAHGVALVAYSPFGSGDFPSPASRGGRVLVALARERGVTPRQLALAFLLRAPGVLTIPKAARTDHLEENVGAGAIRLGEEELRRIDEAFPRGRRRTRLPTI